MNKQETHTAKIGSVLLASKLTIVVPDTDLREFAIQLWPDTFLVFTRPSLFTPAGHFVATELVSASSPRQHPPTFLIGALRTNNQGDLVFQEVGFLSASAKSERSMRATKSDLIVSA